MNALHHHLLEVERLSCAVRALDRPVGEPLAACLEQRERTRREIEYATAQMTRHEISAALLYARLAAPLAS